MKKIFTSILQDCKSWNKILLNRWHLHAPIAFIAGAFMFFLLRNTIADTYIITEIAFKILIPSFLGFICLWGFEAFQQNGRIIGELERFESDKDLWVGEFFLILGVLVSYIL
jgi:hypothetical protein